MSLAGLCVTPAIVARSLSSSGKRGRIAAGFQTHCLHRCISALQMPGSAAGLNLKMIMGLEHPSRGKAERPVAVLLEKSERGSMFVNIQRVGIKRMRPGSFQWSQ